MTRRQSSHAVPVDRLSRPAPRRGHLVASRACHRRQRPVNHSAGRRTDSADHHEFIDTAIANPGMKSWLAEEGEHAMRLLTRHDTDFQPRLVLHRTILTDEADADRLDIPVDLHDLAYVIVRLIESYIYLDSSPGRPRDAHGRADPPHAPALASSPTRPSADNPARPIRTEGRHGLVRSRRRHPQHRPPTTGLRARFQSSSRPSRPGAPPRLTTQRSTNIVCRLCRPARAVGETAPSS